MRQRTANVSDRASGELPLQCSQQQRLPMMQESQAAWIAGCPLRPVLRGMPAISNFSFQQTEQSLLLAVSLAVVSCCPRWSRKTISQVRSCRPCSSAPCHAPRKGEASLLEFLQLPHRMQLRSTGRALLSSPPFFLGWRMRSMPKRPPSLLITTTLMGCRGAMTSMRWRAGLPEVCVQSASRLLQGSPAVLQHTERVCACSGAVEVSQV